MGIYVKTCVRKFCCPTNMDAKAYFVLYRNVKINCRFYQFFLFFLLWWILMRLGDILRSNMISNTQKLSMKSVFEFLLTYINVFFYHFYTFFFFNLVHKKLWTKLTDPIKTRRMISYYAMHMRLSLTVSICYKNVTKNVPSL